jgi:Histidine kinase
VPVEPRFPCFVASKATRAHGEAQCGYRLRMSSVPARGNASFWRRYFSALSASSVGWAVGGAAMAALLLSPTFTPSPAVVFGRTLFVAVVVLLAYTAVGQWRGAPGSRWAWQVGAVVVAAPLGTLLVYAYSSGGNLQKMFSPGRISGMLFIGGCALVLGLIIALGALYRERDAQARQQQLQFAFERETLERQTADAKLAVLQSQVEPHFLFNTLANVQTLVESGSPRAAPVLASLIAYLRAALPQLHDRAPTLGREATLARAYLDLMQMRMPDRLMYSLSIDPALHEVRLPPMTLLTLVENAVRHGIDPSEGGGRIDVGARHDATRGRLTLWVSDTGAGIEENKPPGTGLANLRQRLAATYGERATLVLSAVEPHGVRAEVELPADHSSRP